MALLEVKNLGISFGGLRAVDDLNMSIEPVSYTHLWEPPQLYGYYGGTL